MIKTYIQPIVATGGRTHHLPLCLSLSTARLLHPYVCPSILTILLRAETNAEVWVQYSFQRCKEHLHIRKIDDFR